jgi:cell division protease FtsH
LQKLVRSVAFWVVVALVVLLVASQVLGGGDSREKIRYDEFVDFVAAGKVERVEIDDNSSKITGDLEKGTELEEGTKFRTTFVRESADRVTELLDEADIPYEVKKGGDSIWISLLFQFLPVLLLVGVFLFFLNAMQGGGSRVMQFGKAKARQVSKDQPKVTFADVAGCDEAVEELQEIKEFLESPG